MDIYECHDRYGVSLKKLRLMQRDGVLKIEKDKTPEYWLRVMSDIKKGKMSARSMALTYRYPKKLDNIVHLTRANRRVIDDHFKSIEFPADTPDIDMRFAAPCGAIDKNPVLTAQFIEAIQKIIPDHDVSYQYIAARLLLTCETDFQMNLMSLYLTRAFSSVRDESPMQGWWHSEPGKYGNTVSVYHRPRHYDL